jgi:MFS transporter, Spinster family, sphingosine-1-phosphate transporter
MHDVTVPAIATDASARYRGYLLAVLLSIYAFNFVDRFALGLVLNDIKADLHLTDAQLGLLGGIAFALFYSIMGIPIARWADRGNRVTIISVTAALWSVMVALCGMATTFTQLILIRVGVGIGEAGCVPPAHSLIADYYAREDRPRASAMYQQGVNIGVVVAYLGAGWLTQLYGWRNMFILMSLPGFVLAALSWWTVREPRRWRAATGAAAGVSVSMQPRAGIESGGRTEAPPLAVVAKTLWANRSFRHVLVGFSLWYFFGYGVTNWQPAFFERSFGLSTGELGSWFAVAFGVCGLLGTHWGGAWATRYAPNDERLQLRFMAVINLAFNGVLWSFIYLAHDYRSALVLTGIGALGGALIFGPLFATLQTLVPAHMRAMAIAVVLLCANLIGMGLGPLAVGLLSDALAPHFGIESLRYALLALCPGYLWVSWHFWRAGHTVARDIERAQAVTPASDLAAVPNAAVHP